MKQMKKAIAWILVLTMIFSVIPSNMVYAATTKMSKCKVTLSKSTYNYTGSACKPNVTVKYKGKKLKKGKNYTISYTDNVNTGTATVVIKGKGKYSGTVKKRFKIKNALSVKLTQNIFTYTGENIKPAFTVKYGSKKLTGKNYKVTYKNNQNVGTAELIIKGKGKYKKKNAYITFQILAASLDDATVELSQEAFEYTGKACVPGVTVKKGNAVLNSGTDYTVAYSNNIDAGTATVTVTGTGNYTGTVNKTFTINAPAPTPEANPEFNLPDNGLIWEGDRFDLSVTGSKTFTFSSSDEGIVRIENGNILYANRIGTVTITAKCEDIEFTRNLTVIKADANSPREIIPGDTYKMNITAYGKDASVFAFESSDTKLATVDKDGLLYAVPGEGGEVTISLLADTICGRKGWSTKVNVLSIASMYTTVKSEEGYKTVTEAAANAMTDGQASDIRILSYELGKCDKNGFYYNNQIATVKKGDYDYYFVADTWNNRVMIYRTKGDEVWDNSTEPYIVLGQTDFTTSTPLTKSTIGNNLAKMNWPVGVAACVDASEKIHIFVTDSYNDRILVWNDLPTENGAAADFAMYNVVDPNSASYVGGTDTTEIGWPWAIWSDGEKLICTDTRSSRILIWNGVPESAADYPDSVVFTGANTTPRSIITDGEYLIVGDHNVRLDDGRVSQGYHVYDSVSSLLGKGSYVNDPGERFVEEEANPGGIILERDLKDEHGGTILKKGSLIMTYAGSIKVFASEDGNTRKLKYDGEEPDYYVGGGSPDEPMGYYFVGGDCMQIIVDSKNNLYSTHFNKSMIVGYANGTFPGKPETLSKEEIDSRTGDIFEVEGKDNTIYFYRQSDGVVEEHSAIRPNLSVGTALDKIDVSASNARNHYQNCFPDTLNGYMVVSCDHPLGTNLMIYKNVPDESGAIPDITYTFKLSASSRYARLFESEGKTGVIAGGKSTLFIWNDINDAIEGKTPNTLMNKMIGNVSTEGTEILGFDYVDGYFIIAIGGKVYVFEGFPERGQEPLKTINFSLGAAGSSHDIRGKKTADGKIYVCFTGTERGIRIVELSEILGKEKAEFAGTELSGLIGELEFDYSANGEDRLFKRDFEATSTYITNDGHVISIVGFSQLWIWDSVEKALAGEKYKTRLGIGEDYYCLKDLNSNLVKTDFVKIQAPTTLFMATNITFDERGYLWVADYKFGGGIRRFTGKLN